MLKSLIAMSLAVLAYNAPAASADAPSYDCRLRSVQQDSVTGQTHEAALVGVIAHADSSSVSIRCRLTVDGVTQAATPVGTGTAVAATQGNVSFAAGETSVVRICADYGSAHGSGTVCVTISTFRVPEAFELLSTVFQTFGSVFTDVLDPTLCPVFEDVRSGDQSVVYVDNQGDVYVFGELYYDCPPYQIHGNRQR